MGNIQGSVLESAKRRSNGSNSGTDDMRTLRYAVREELKNLADDPSQRTLYKLLHPTVPESEHKDGDIVPSDMNDHQNWSNADAAPNSDACKYDTDANSPGSPRLIIDETIVLPTGNDDRGHSNREDGEQWKDAVAKRQDETKHLSSNDKDSNIANVKIGNTMTATLEPQRSRSGSISTCLAPKKKFLQNYNSQQPDEDSRLRTMSFSNAATKPNPEGKTKEDCHRSRAYTLPSHRKRPHIPNQKEDDDQQVKKIDIRSAIDHILDSDAIRDRLMKPSEEYPASSDSSSLPNLQAKELQHQMTQAMRACDTGSQRSSPVSRTSTPHATSIDSGRINESEEANRGNPLDKLAAQVDSMPQPSAANQKPIDVDEGSNISDASTSKLAPQAEHGTQYPTNYGPQNPQSNSPAQTSSEGLNTRFPQTVNRQSGESHETRHPQVAAILPIPQLPRQNEASISPAPDKHVVYAEESSCDKPKSDGLTGAEATLTSKEKAIQMERHFRNMINDDLNKVWQPSASAKSPSPSEPVSVAKQPTPSVSPSSNHSSSRRNSFSSPNSMMSSSLWSSYKPQTDKERADILKESRHTIVYPENRMMGSYRDDKHKLLYPAPHATDEIHEKFPVRNSERLPQESRQQSEETPLDLSAKPPASNEEHGAFRYRMDEKDPRYKPSLSDQHSKVGQENLPHHYAGSSGGIVSGHPVGFISYSNSTSHSGAPHAGSSVVNHTQHQVRNQAMSRLPNKNTDSSKNHYPAAEVQPSHGQHSPSMRTSQSPASRPTVGSLLGEHSANDILFLRCNLCDSNYGNLHGFRKHFHKAHNLEPGPEHIKIQTISAAKAQIGEDAKLMEGYRLNLETDVEFTAKSQALPVVSRHSEPPGDYNVHPKYRAVRAEDGRKVELIPQPQPMPVSSITTQNVRGSPHKVQELSAQDGDLERRGIPGPMNGSSVFKCPHCPSEFPTRDWGAYTRHVKSHEAPVSQPQSHSPAKTSGLVAGKEGWDREKGPLMGIDFALTCHICRAVFSQQEALSRHYQAVHSKNSIEASNEYHCPLCSKTFVHESGLLAHLPDHGERAVHHYMPEVKDRSYPGDEPRRSQHSPHQPNIYHSQQRNLMEPPTSTPMYSRRMSLSEASYRAGLKRHSNNPLSSIPEDVKRPRSGSFPNVQDLLQRRGDTSRVGLHHPMSHFPQQNSAHHPYTHSQQPSYPGKVGQHHPKTFIDENPSSMTGKKDVTAANPQNVNPRSLLDQMVESAVSELATNPMPKTSQQPKILPRLFKGDPLEKVWPPERSDTERPEAASQESQEDRTITPVSINTNTPRVSAEKVSSDMWMARGDSHSSPCPREPATSTPKTTLPTAPQYVPAKRPENVRDIIESLVTAEVTGVNAIRPRANSEHNIGLARAKLGSYSGSNLLAMRQTQGTDENQPKSSQTFRETISNVIEKSMTTCGESMNREERSLSRLRQLMTEEPDFVRQERERMDYLHRQPKKIGNIPPKDTLNKNKINSIVEGIKMTGTGKSMREICDQIIAESLTTNCGEIEKQTREEDHPESSKAKDVQDETAGEDVYRGRSFSASMAQSPHLFARLYGQQHVPNARLPVKDTHTLASQREQMPGRLPMTSPGSSSVIPSTSSTRSLAAVTSEKPPVTLSANSEVPSVTQSTASHYSSSRSFFISDNQQQSSNNSPAHEMAGKQTTGEEGGEVHNTAAMESTKEPTALSPKQDEVRELEENQNLSPACKTEEKISPVDEASVTSKTGASPHTTDGQIEKSANLAE